MTPKTFSVVFTALILAGTATMLAVAQDEQSPAIQIEPSASNGLAVAKAYIAGMEAGDLDALDALFVANEKSSILENASNEGSWEYYRDHHLKPEMDVVKNFKFVITQESEKAYGDTILVEQVGTFSVEIREEKHDYRVAVSYLMVTEGGQLRIAHLHWSSRPQK